MIILYIIWLLVEYKSVGIQYISDILLYISNKVYITFIWNIRVEYYNM